MSQDEPAGQRGQGVETLQADVGHLRAEVVALRQALAMRGQEISDGARRAAVLETALLSLPVGVAVYDPEDRLIIKNNRFQLYDQTGARDRPGTAFVDIMKFGFELGLYPDALDDPESWIDARMHRRRNPGDVTIQQISDGRFIQIEERRLEDGRLVSAYTDVTQLKHTEEALSVALRRSEEANEAKTAFLAKMSHELRTPRESGTDT